MKKIFYISILAASTVLTSCDDLFEPATENHRQIEAMWEEPSYAQGILGNAYINLPYETGPQSDLATDDAVTNDMSSNLLRMGTGSWAAEMNPLDQWTYRYNAINFANIMLENSAKVKWAKEEMPNKMYNDLFNGDAYALRALHYFYVLRAHCGYTIEGQLMGVPLLLESVDALTAKDALNVPRSSFVDCIKQINSDLDKAAELLPYEYVGNVGEAANNALYINKYKAQGATPAEFNRVFGSHQRGKLNGKIVEAIKAQVAFFAASPAFNEHSGVTWEQAADLLAVVLKRINGVAGMDPNGWKWFADNSKIDAWNFNMKDHPEAEPADMLWRGGRGGDATNLEEDYFPPSQWGKGRVNPTQNLVDAFPMANGYPITEVASGYNDQDPYTGRDPRLNAYIIVNGDKIGGYGGDNDKTIITGTYGDNRNAINREMGVSTRTGYYMRKWVRDDVNLNPNGKSGKKHYTPRIRYTELFLDYAEAANEKWGPMAPGPLGNSAYDIIKAIRSRAGVGKDNGDAYLESIKDNKDKMRELIRNERRLELCFENYRFWDLRRWKVSLNMLNEPAKGIQIEKLDDGTLKYTVLPEVEKRVYKDYMYYGPIPFSEIRKWNALEQNAGW